MGERKKGDLLDVTTDEEEEEKEEAAAVIKCPRGLCRGLPQPRAMLMSMAGGQGSALLAPAGQYGGEATQPAGSRPHK